MHHQHSLINDHDVAVLVPVSDHEMLNVEKICNVFSSSVIFERDVDFGSVQSIDTSYHADNQLDVDSLPSRRIPTSELSHLSVTQRTQLLALLDKYCLLF